MGTLLDSLELMLLELIGMDLKDREKKTKGQLGTLEDSSEEGRRVQAHEDEVIGDEEDDELDEVELGGALEVELLILPSGRQEGLDVEVGEGSEKKLTKTKSRREEPRTMKRRSCWARSRRKTKTSLRRTTRTSLTRMKRTSSMKRTRTR